MPNSVVVDGYGRDQSRDFSQETHLNGRPHCGASVEAASSTTYLSERPQSARREAANHRHSRGGGGGRRPDLAPAHWEGTDLGRRKDPWRDDPQV
jgi:hypothetical protein